MSAGVEQLFARLPGGKDDAIRWARSFGDDLGRAWDECPRGDWLLWLAGILEVDPMQVALAVCDGVSFSLSLLPLAEQESELRESLKRVEHWTLGADDADSCVAAARELLTVYEESGKGAADGPPTAGYAAAAVSAALMLPTYRSAFGVACGAAAATLKAAQVATAGDEGAIEDAHRRIAELARERIPFEEVVEAAGFKRFASSAASGGGAAPRRG